jgi:hypothetical protein
VKGNTSATKKLLSQTGTGTISAAPVWSALSSADLPAVTTIPTANKYAGWDTNKNLSANSFIYGYSTTVTAAGTTTLTVVGG